jgi:hypothetical protein
VKDKIILEYRFTIHQILMILIVVGLFWLVIISLLLDVLTNNTLLYPLFFYPGYGLLITLAFSKKGFYKHNGQLYFAYFFLGLPFYKTAIDITKFPKLSVLRFKKSRKLPWFSVARPDAANDFTSYEINILNDSHTSRKIIMELKKEELIKPSLDFLTTHSELIHESYNPKTRRKRRFNKR